MNAAEGQSTSLFRVYAPTLPAIGKVKEINFMVLPGSYEQLLIVEKGGTDT